MYQQKIKQRKDKRETAGKWTSEGMKRLNSLITMVQEDRNKETREDFEEELQDMYVKYADKNMEQISRNKRKRELDEMIREKEESKEETLKPKGKGKEKVKRKRQEQLWQEYKIGLGISPGIVPRRKA